MILRTRIDNSGLTEFEKRFLFQEAPGEEETPRKNVKRIRLKAIDRRRRDETKKAAIEGPVEMEEALPEEPDMDTETEEETPQTEENPPEEEMDTTEDTEEFDMGNDDIAIDDSDDLGDMDMDDEGAEDDMGEDTETSSGDGDIAIDDSEVTPEDGEDNADGGDGSEENSGEGDQTGDDNSGTEEEDQDDIMHKQNLYRKFMNLHESVSNYCQKLDTQIGIDDETNRQYKEVGEKLKQLKEFLYTYMVIKFTHEEYVQSLLFYQRSLAAANLLLDTLSEIRKKEEKQVTKN